MNELSYLEKIMLEVSFSNLTNDEQIPLFPIFDLLMGFIASETGKFEAQSLDELKELSAEINIASKHLLAISPQPPSDDVEKWKNDFSRQVLEMKCLQTAIVNEFVRMLNLVGDAALMRLNELEHNAGGGNDTIN
ncbi:hypothetical protein HPC38_05005 [Pasteurellaceae bacterium HPA106]|uniref:hypothetical protein n=1 Tax=Spirabiliibacterium pneumoniae TaxID=221400 RepID=UPI001AACDD45|nr:hypothetical protein [Spirabiliibacterium pneumoniae]MBE2896233.1 hypothetical protein [Spirabiliibacterium pneumoniae]